MPDAGEATETPGYQTSAAAASDPRRRSTVVCGAVPERRLLDATELFAALPDRRARAARATRRRSATLAAERAPLPPGRRVARAVRASSSGRIAIATRSPDGRESMVAVLESGGLFGELGLFDDGPRSADARALDRLRASSCSATTPCARCSRRDPSSSG